MLDDVKFVHPKDVQDGKVDLGAGDITTNLPYHPGVWGLKQQNTAFATGKSIIDRCSASSSAASPLTVRQGLR
jgi:hypothetical protein